MSANSRLAWCAFICLTPTLPITARLTRLQILDRSALDSKARQETQRLSLETAPRGRILDRFGHVLAQSLPSPSSFIDPSLIRNPNHTATVLASTLGLPGAEIRSKFKSHSRFVWLKRKMNPAESEALQRMHLNGVGIVADQQRYYPSGDTGRNLLGVVGQEGKGLSGLELQFESYLAGKPVSMRWIRDGSGKAVMLQPERAAEIPPDVRLTLDRDIQHYAEAVLEEGVGRSQPKQALVMVQDPKTGDILAAASYPQDALKAYSMEDAYEPGSTYKLVTLAGVLEEKLDVPGERIDGENGQWELAPGVHVKDHEPSGAMTLAEVFEKSSNIGAAKLGLRLGPEKFYNYSRAFGFGCKTGLAYPGESAGLLKSSRQMTRVALANNAFGQGLAVSPMQLLSAYSAIANGGVLMEPRLLLSIGDRVASAPAQVRRVVSAGTAHRLTELLEGVVDRGTGIPARVPGYSIAGKTGTAQKTDPSTGHYSTSQYVASFVGFAPSRDPQFAVLVVMDSPKNQYYGSDVAAPVFAKLMRELLAFKGIPQDRRLLTSR